LFQVEFYFSDANITKDKFLLKHVRRNKEGFVSLKLVASFKRVKHLTRDWRQVTEAVERKAERLEVNAARTKVNEDMQEKAAVLELNEIWRNQT
jgi:la-related protein 6